MLGGNDLISNKLDNIELTSVEKSVLNTILNYDFETIDIKIKEVAEIASVSISTISRLVRKLGFDNFNEFKAYLYIENKKLKEKINIKNTDIEVENELNISPKLLLFYNMINNRVLDSLKEINMGQIEEMANVILKSKKVVLVGFSSSGTVAEEIFYLFRRLGINAALVEDPHRIAFECYNLEENESILFFSHSGETVELINTAKLTKKNNVSILTITNDPTSLLALESDYVGSYRSSDFKYLEDYPFHTIVQLFVGYVLVDAILSNSLYNKTSTMYSILDLLMIEKI